MDLELAKNYKAVSVLATVGGLPAPNPLLDVLLPSLLYVRMSSALDEALEEYIDRSGLNFGKPYKNDFNGRICFLADNDRLRLVLDSTSSFFDVSPFATDRRSSRSWNPSVTPSESFP